jgi:hypothetical protein
LLSEYEVVSLDASVAPELARIDAETLCEPACYTEEEFRSLLTADPQALTGLRDKKGNLLAYASIFGVSPDYADQICEEVRLDIPHVEANRIVPTEIWNNRVLDWYIDTLVVRGKVRDRRRRGLLLLRLLPALADKYTRLAPRARVGRVLTVAVTPEGQRMAERAGMTLVEQWTSADVVRSLYRADYHGVSVGQNLRAMASGMGRLAGSVILSWLGTGLPPIWQR